MNPLRLFGWGQSTFSGKAVPTKSCPEKSSLTPALETDKWHSNLVHDAQAIIFLFFNLRNWRNWLNLRLNCLGLILLVQLMLQFQRMAADGVEHGMEAVCAGEGKMGGQAYFLDEVRLGIDDLPGAAS